MIFTQAHHELTRTAAAKARAVATVAVVAGVSYQAEALNRGMGFAGTRGERRSPVSFWSLKPAALIQGCQVQLPEDPGGWQEQGWRMG